MTDRGAELRKGIAAIWQKSLPHVREQLAELVAVAASAREGALTPEQCRSGEREAHRLAGSLGAFGFHEGTRIARELETIFASRIVTDARGLEDLVSQLKQSIEL